MVERYSLRAGLFTAAVVGSLVSAAPAFAQRAAFSATHVPSVVASGTAERLSNMEGSQKLQIVLALPTRNQPELDTLLHDLQDPSSANYHKYITPAQYTERFAATQADYAKVVAYARAQGFEEIELTPNRHLVIAKATVEQINRSFHVNMGVYQHPTEDRTFFSADREPTVSGLSVKLVEVAGLNDLVRPHSYLKHKPEVSNPSADVVADAAPKAGSGPSGQYIPSDMRAAYYGSGSLTGSGVYVGIIGFGNYLQSDLTLFTTKTGESLPVPMLVPPSFTNQVTACQGGGATGTGCDDGEQTLDIEQVNGMAPGTKGIYFYATDYLGATSDLPMINAIATQNLASIVTSSWGWTPTNQASEDASFQQMQAQGQTFLNATGDSGAYYQYTNSRGKVTTNYSYPSANPYILEVGATDLTTNGAGGSWSSETAWPDSSGGSSPVAGYQYAIPSWQAFSGVINSSNQGSSTLRNDPDVAAEGNFDNYICDNGTCSTGYGGTSFAAPRWAGYLALLQQQSIADGNGFIGFVNPMIYRVAISNAHSANFHDITSGSNKNSHSNNLYNAVAGYDDVTGWGSPNGASLISAIAAPVLSVSPTSGSTATSFSLGVNYPDIDGTAKFYAKQGTTVTQIGSCTVTTTVGTNSSCTTSFNGSTLGVGSYSIYAVYTETAAYNGTTRTQTKTSPMTPITIADSLTVSASATPGSITTSQTSNITGTVTDSSNSAIKLAGSVSFTAGAKNLGSCTLSNGSCSVSVAGSTLGTGNFTIVPSYTPASGYTVTSVINGSLSVTAPASVITFSSVSHNMGSVTVGSTSAVYGVYMTNNTPNTVTYGVTFSNPNAGFFESSVKTLAAGASTELNFGFKPTATGAVSTTWSLTGIPNGVTFSPSNGGTLTGTGVSAGQVTITTNGHNFGTVAVGSTSAVFGAVLTNSTASAVTLSVGATTSPFTQTLNSCGASLAAGASCNLQWTFKPTATGTVSTTVPITSSSPIYFGSTAVTGMYLAGTGQ